MARLLIFHIIFHDILFSGTWTWIVRMPSSIQGLSGSCLVIPCSFDYSNSIPHPDHIVWYEYDKFYYPVVYDAWKISSVMNEFRGKTFLYKKLDYCIGEDCVRDCSLLITNLKLIHNGRRIYAWIDPDNIGKHTYRFFDVTSRIFVKTSAEKPIIQILGGNQIGDLISVQCSTYHSCPYQSPTLSLSGLENKKGLNDHMETIYRNDGKWETILTRKGVVQSVSQTVRCNVRHQGGLSESATKTHKASCAIYQPQITPDANTEFLEGVETEILCSVMYICPENRPYITWKGVEIPASMFFVKDETRSILKFMAKASDQGKVITCQAEFKGNVQSASITLRIKRSMFSRDWTFSMPKAITGLPGSCVVIPCSFDFKTSQPKNVKVKWYKFSSTEYPLVYGESTQNIIGSFRDKTSLFGAPNEGNCSLKIQPLEKQHNQERLYPWMDPNSIETYHREKYEDVTITLAVSDVIEKPQVDIIGIPKVGEQITLSCSVSHTCPPTPPTLKLNISRGTESLMHIPLSEGKWKTVKEATWDVQEDDNSVSCTVSYPSGQTSKAEVSLNPLCDFDSPKISPREDETMEGIEKIFNCSVQHTCEKQKPIITWNYQHMEYSAETQQISSKTWKTVSVLKFKASRDDHGKKLICTAQSVDGQKVDSVDLKVKRGRSSVDWTYSMPIKIKGLRGSCMVIPCTFDFKTTQPGNIIVKWYLDSSRGYPLVYAQNGENIVGKYHGKTKLYGLPSERNCSLEINTLELDHNGDRLYPWMDPKPVEAFHKENYDSSVEIQVTAQADKPKLSITGIPRVGEQITVSCSVYHTCPSSPPNLLLGEVPLNIRTVHTPMQNGLWEFIRHYTFSIREDDHHVTCKATFQGGQISEAQISLNAQCIHKDIIIDPEEADVIEGFGKNFTCTVFHSCKKEPPTISWNYKDMPETSGIKKYGLSWTTYSNILFLASMEDHGKKLICTAKFPDVQITASVVLQVLKYEPKDVDPFENDTVHVLEANVFPRISALTRSCVVIPCSFKTGDEPLTRLRSLWITRKGEYVFHTGQSNVLDNFKGRTQLLGNPDEQNCTLEIDNVQPHDNGPFCFRAERGNDKYRFNHSCVFISMKASPNKPVISDLPEEMEPGKRFKIQCSITHTCSSHPPTITWNVPAAREVMSHTDIGAGQWETTSTITFIPTGYEKEENLICSALFWRGKKQESVTYLSVKRYEGLGMDTIGPYIIVPLLLLCIIAGILFIIYKRRRRKQTSSTTEKRASLWNQFSRRFDGGARWINSVSKPSRPPKPEKRRSLWNRFSRKDPLNSSDVRMECMLNNTSTGDRSSGFSKPRFPSPKSLPKSYCKGGHSAHHYDNDDYTNTADLNIYGNI
ncbi:uncharacterized protein LOC113587700 [Electrophorus electricus]|uniref:uncharacterized protein LOC113587700 n=1 Tax=Electrophorus electricus TaxID=8005 RepID=UPI0015D06552|nr:uncharacterized protein LOC113587700 [Electrophorus electricus]